MGYQQGALPSCSQACLDPLLLFFEGLTMQPGLQSEFQDTQGYTEKRCLEKTNNNNNKKETCGE